MDIGKALLPLGEDLRKLPEHAYRIENQIVKVERIEVILALDVVFIDFCLDLLSGVRAGQHIGPLHGDIRRLVVGDIVQQGAVGIGLGIDLEFLVRLLQDALLIIRIEDGKVSGPSHGLDIFPQDAHAEGVNGGNPGLGGFILQHLPDTFLHFVGRFVGKGDRKDLCRPDIPVLNQMRDPHRQNTGLSRSCACDDPQVFMFIEHRILLLVIQRTDINHVQSPSLCGTAAVPLIISRAHLKKRSAA